MAVHDNSCSLCAQGKGCSRLLALFPQRTAPSGVEPNIRLAHRAYGIPLALSLIGAVAGNVLGEWQSVLGFFVGLVTSFFLIRRMSVKNLS